MNSYQYPTKHRIRWVRTVTLSGALKYILIAALAAFVVLIMIFSSGSNKPFEEVAAAVEAQIDTDALERADNMTFKSDYGLNATDYEGVMLYVSKNYLEAQEVLLVKVANDEQLVEVEDAIDQRIENRINDFDGYLPEQVLLLDEALITTRGNYILLAVSEDADSYQKALNQAL